MEVQQHFEEEEEEEGMEEVEKKVTVKELASVFSKVNADITELENMDPNVERFTKVERQLNELSQCYCEIYEEKKKLTKQVTLTKLFSKTTPRTPTHTSTFISSPSSSLPKPSTAPDDSDHDLAPQSHFEGFDD